MSGFYDDIDEEQDFSAKKMIIIAICTVSLVFLGFLILMYVGTKPHKPVDSKTQDISSAETVEQDESDELHLSNSGLTSSDLDFWYMFGDNDKKQNNDIQKSDDTEGTPAVFTEQGVKPDKIGNIKNEDDNPDAKWVNGDPDNGTHIGITDSNGNKIWYEILDIAKSPYTSNYIKDLPNGMLQYDDGSVRSVLGADISSDMGTVDITSLKPSGISYVMIRSHYRDKSTGIISEDPMFNTFIIGAQKEGLNIGISIDSQALNETEATEEANYAIVSATTYSAKYPIALNIPDLSDSGNRMSKLSSDMITNVIKTFCDRVISYGFKPVIHANKNDLIAKIKIEDLAQYDIWVNDNGISEVRNMPYFTDYPYKFTMWQYDRGINRCGLSGSAGLDLSFVKYEQN